MAPNLLFRNLIHVAEGVGGTFVLTSAILLLAQQFERVNGHGLHFLVTAFGVSLSFGLMGSEFIIEWLD
ncbi:MAG: hypothetical protein ACSLEL_02270 [Candidatus Malihini olakiniferum]